MLLLIDDEAVPAGLREVTRVTAVPAILTSLAHDRSPALPSSFRRGRRRDRPARRGGASPLPAGRVRAPRRPGGRRPGRARLPVDHSTAGPHRIGAAYRHSRDIRATQHPDEGRPGLSPTVAIEAAATPHAPRRRGRGLGGPAIPIAGRARRLRRSSPRPGGRPVPGRGPPVAAGWPAGAARRHRPAAVRTSLRPPARPRNFSATGQASAVSPVLTTLTGQRCAIYGWSGSPSSEPSSACSSHSAKSSDMDARPVASSSLS
jgi:hypothetical protein